jgi:thiol-disulfide isomerase/thioredoxin
VIHLRSALAAFAKEYQVKGLGIVGINSNDVANYPDDSPERMKAEAKSAGYTFPYLFDDSQEVAQAYGAACTPDFFLYDSQHRLVYRGQFDDSRPSNGKPITGADLRAACDAALAGKALSATQKPSIGCNIKWKSGQAPAYFTGQPATTE